VGRHRLNAAIDVGQGLSADKINAGKAAQAFETACFLFTVDGQPFRHFVDRQRPEWRRDCPDVSALPPSE
jgi:hypothetical protein